MTITELIRDLQSIRAQYGEVKVQLQNTPKENEIIENDEEFFVVPELYEDGWYVNIRTWPY